MPNRSTTVSNGTDQITFAIEDGGVAFYINDLYITHINKNTSNERGWDELRNIGNQLPVDDMYEKFSSHKSFPSWMDIEENHLERVLTCNNCDNEVGALMYHESRHHFENYDFDNIKNEFVCNKCGSRDVKETFEVTDSDGNTVEYVKFKGQWRSIESLDGNEEWEILKVDLDNYSSRL